MPARFVPQFWDSATPWTAAFQAPPSMGFSRQEYWSGVPLPSPQMSLEIQILRNMKNRHSNKHLNSATQIKNQNWNSLQNCMCVSCSVVSDFVTPWTVACQDPLSMGFSRQEYWSGAISFSRGSSQPRDWSRVSCIVDRRFTIWPTREVLSYIILTVFFFFWPHCVTCGILVLWPEIEPGS